MSSVGSNVWSNRDDGKGFPAGLRLLLKLWLRGRINHRCFSKASKGGEG